MQTFITVLTHIECLTSVIKSSVGFLSSEPPKTLRALLILLSCVNILEFYIRYKPSYSSHDTPKYR